MVFLNIYVFLLILDVKFFSGEKNGELVLTAPSTSTARFGRFYAVFVTTKIFFIW